MAGQGTARRGEARQGKARLTFNLKGVIMAIVQKKIEVSLEGLSEIMFDRYPGDNNTTLEPQDKVYLDSDKYLILPSTNIMSFITAENTVSAPKLIYDSRQYKGICKAIKSSVIINPSNIKFKHNNEYVEYNGIPDTSGMYIHESVARLDKGIPNPKKRPVLELPWSLDFEILFMDIGATSTKQLLEVFEKGGLMLGLGTYRGVFGKFLVKKWNVSK